MITFKQYLFEKRITYFGESASGAIIFAEDTKRILFLLRSGEEDSEQGQWEITIGGRKEPSDPDALANVDREIEEEIGHIPGVIDTKLIELFFDTSDNHEPFKYFVYIKRISHEFDPTLSNEHSDFKWIDIKTDEMPEPLHFGAERLLKNQKVIDLLK